MEKAEGLKMKTKKSQHKKTPNQQPPLNLSPPPQTTTLIMKIYRHHTWRRIFPNVTFGCVKDCTVSAWKWTPKPEELSLHTLAAEPIGCPSETAPTPEHAAVRANGVLTVLAPPARVASYCTLINVYN